MAPEGSNPAAILTLLLNQMKLRSNNIRCIFVQLVKVCFLFQFRISIATSYYVFKLFIIALQLEGTLIIKLLFVRYLISVLKHCSTNHTLRIHAKGNYWLIVLPA